MKSEKSAFEGEGGLLYAGRNILSSLDGIGPPVPGSPFPEAYRQG